MLRLYNLWNLNILNNRVLHVVESLNLHTGGPSQSVPALYRERLNAGFRDKIVTTHLSAKDKSHKYSKTSFYAFFGKIRFSPLLILFLIKNRHDFDVVHINCIWNFVFLSALIIGKFMKKKVVLSTRGMLRFEHINTSIFKKLIFNFLLRKLLDFVDRFHISTDWEKNELNNIGINSEKIDLVYNLHQFMNYEGTLQTKISKNERFTFLYVGRIHPYKQILELIEAYRSLPIEDLRQAKLLLVGPCDDKNYIRKVKQKIDESKEYTEIDLLGFLDGAELRRQYVNASVFVMPSKSENFGMSIFEALQFKTLVIVPELSPWPSLLPESIVQVVAKDTSNLRDCLKSSLDNLRNGKVNFGKFEKILDQFRSKRILEKYNKMYERT